MHFFLVGVFLTERNLQFIPLLSKFLVLSDLDEKDFVIVANWDYPGIAIDSSQRPLHVSAIYSKSTLHFVFALSTFGPFPKSIF